MSTEDEEDIEIARARLAEIEADPALLVRKGDPAYDALMSASLLREPFTAEEQAAIDVRELERRRAMTPEERREHAKASIASKPDWWREGLEEAKRQDAEWLAVRPPNDGRDITKEEWGKLIDEAPEKWKKAFERMRQRRIAEQNATSEEKIAPPDNDPVWLAAMRAPMVSDRGRAERRLIRRMHRDGVRTSGREIGRMMRVERHILKGRHTWAIDQGRAAFAVPCEEPAIGKRIVWGHGQYVTTGIVVEGLCVLPGVVWARDSRGGLHSFPRGYELRVCI